MSADWGIQVVAAEDIVSAFAELAAIMYAIGVERDSQPWLSAAGLMLPVGWCDS